MIPYSSYASATDTTLRTWDGIEDTAATSYNTYPFNTMDDCVRNCVCEITGFDKPEEVHCSYREITPLLKKRRAAKIIYPKPFITKIRRTSQVAPYIIPN